MTTLRRCATVWQRAYAVLTAALPGLDTTGAFSSSSDDNGDDEGGVAFDVGVQVWKLRWEDEGAGWFADGSGWPVARWVKFRRAPSRIFSPRLRPSRQR